MGLGPPWGMHACYDTTCPPGGAPPSGPLRVPPQLCSNPWLGPVSSPALRTCQSPRDFCSSSLPLCPASSHHVHCGLTLGVGARPWAPPAPRRFRMCFRALFSSAPHWPDGDFQGHRCHFVQPLAPPGSRTPRVIVPKTLFSSQEEQSPFAVWAPDDYLLPPPPLGMDVMTTCRPVRFLPSELHPPSRTGPPSALGSHQ